MKDACDWQNPQVFDGHGGCLNTLSTSTYGLGVMDIDSSGQIDHGGTASRCKLSNKNTRSLPHDLDGMIMMLFVTNVPMLKVVEPGARFGTVGQISY